MIRRFVWAAFVTCGLGLSSSLARAGEPPAAARDLYERAKDAQARGELDTALAGYTKAIELHPDYAWAYNNRGNVKDKRGDPEGALVDFTRAIEIDARHGTAFFNRGNVRSAQGDLDGALADYTAAIGIDPKDAQAFNNRGDVKERKGDLDGALADFDAAIDLDPRYVRAYDNRGVLRAEKGDTDGALADFTRVLELDPRHANAASGRGITKLRIRDFDGAIRDLSRALELDPNRDYSRFFRFLAQALGGGGEVSARAGLVAGRAASSPLAEGAFTRRVDEFLEGRLTSEALQKLADESPEAFRAGRQCEARFYAGMVAWIRGDKAGATALLERCVATGKAAYAELITARAVLAWPR